jgi:hypothetical protein
MQTDPNEQEGAYAGASRQLLSRIGQFVSFGHLGVGCAISSGLWCS